MVHAAGERNDGIVCDAEHYKTGPAHAAQVLPDRHGEPWMKMKKHSG
jgi:hypothetical protein